jgi:hypothetical protein
MTLKLKLAMPKSICSQHYRILREAGLIVLEAQFPGLLASILKSYEKESSRQAR